MDADRDRTLVILAIAAKETSMQIRPFEVADTEPIIDLALRAWAPVFAALEPAVPDYVYEAFYPNGWRPRQDHDIRALLADDATDVYVACIDGAIAGFVGVRLHPEDRMGEIHILAVDPAHQRCGVATALIDHALETIRAAGMAIVMVETGDDPGHGASRATYEHAGFERWPVARYFRKL